jgi:SSS family solute:Na+ symporter
MGILAQKRVKKHEDMSVGGRSFTAWSIFYTLFAFWGGNTIAGIVELAHKDGVVSAWFGIARMTMFFLILFITGSAFRKLAMITLSDYIAQRFESPFLRLLSGIIIAINFTIFTVSSVVGAAAFFTAILGWPVWISVCFTVVSFLAYTTLGGMHALSYNGKILTVGQLLTLLVAAVVGIYQAGWGNIMQLEPQYFDFTPPTHIGTIMVWFFTFITNAFVAQAALQIVMSCKTIEEGRKGVLFVAIGFLPVIILAPLAGMAAKVMYPAIKSVQAMPMLASNMPSAILSSIVVLGLYFTTLGWASSCILSGGTVAANDIYRFFVPNASSSQLIKASRVSIVLLSVLTIGFALLVPSGVEFWTIVGFVIRNAGLFPLILIGLFWNAISRRSAVAAALAGSITGIVWYLVKAPPFLFNAHPMFVGMVVSMLVVSVGTLIEYRGRLSFSSSPVGMVFAVLGIAGIGLSLIVTPALVQLKILFAFISFAVCFLFLALLFLVKRSDVKSVVVEESAAVELA